MKHVARTARWCAAAAFTLLLAGTGVIFYQYGYMQSAIDHNVAAFSAPAYVAVFSGAPYLVGAILTGVMAAVLLKKSR